MKVRNPSARIFAIVLTVLIDGVRRYGACIWAHQACCGARRYASFNCASCGVGADGGYGRLHQPGRLDRGDCTLIVAGVGNEEVGLTPRVACTMYLSHRK